jgi:hypothetical protein
VVVVSQFVAEVRHRCLAWPEITVPDSLEVPVIPLIDANANICERADRQLLLNVNEATQVALNGW